MADVQRSADGRRRRVDREHLGARSRAIEPVDAGLPPTAASTSLRDLRARAFRASCRRAGSRLVNGVDERDIATILLDGALMRSISSRTRRSAIGGDDVGDRLAHDAVGEPLEDALRDLLDELVGDAGAGGAGTPPGASAGGDPGERGPEASSTAEARPLDSAARSAAKASAIGGTRGGAGDGDAAGAGAADGADGGAGATASAAAGCAKDGDGCAAGRSKSASGDTYDNGRSGTAGSARGRHAEPIDARRPMRRSDRRRGRRRRFLVEPIRERGVQPIEVVDRCRRRPASAPAAAPAADRSSRAGAAAAPVGRAALHPADDQLRLERLRQHAVAAGRRRSRVIDRLERARQQDDGNVGEPGGFFDVLRDLVAVLAGHADVGQHDVRRRGVEARDRLVAVADRDDLDVLVRERQLDDALNGDAVVGEEERMGHGLFIGRSRPAVQGTRSYPRTRVGIDEIDDALHRRSGQEDPLDADLCLWYSAQNRWRASPYSGIAQPTSG